VTRKNNNSLFRPESTNRGDELLGAPVFSEIQNATRYLNILMLSLVVLGLLLAFYPVNRTVKLSGNLSTSPKLAILENPVKSTLTSIEKSSDTAVVTDDPLFILSPILNSQQSVSLEATLNSIKSNIELLTYEKSQSEKIYNDELSQLRRSSEYHKSRIHDNKESLRLTEIRNRNVERYVSNLKNANALIYDIQTAENQLWDAKNELQNKINTVNQHSYEYEKTQYELRKLKSNYTIKSNQLQNELQNANKLLDLEKEKKRYVISSPVVGRFKTKFKNEGHVIEAGSLIGYVVPENIQFVVKMAVNEKLTSRIKTDQRVYLETDLFPRNDHGVFSGFVSSIENLIKPSSHDTSSEEKSFLVQIEIDDLQLIKELINRDVYDEISFRARILTGKVNLWHALIGD